MADIKFMNLSENGNPATTDSVLIGNSADGLKRATLGTIGNMFSVHQALHFEEVSVLTSTQADKATNPNNDTEIGVGFDVSAPSVPGYTFKCWIGSQTNGFIAPTYMSGKLNSNGQVWAYAPQWAITNDSNSVTATALYIKNELA